MKKLVQGERLLDWQDGLGTGVLSRRRLFDQPRFQPERVFDSRRKNGFDRAVWKPHSTEFIENLEREIDLKAIDFVIANHGEIDHSGSLPALMAKIPNTPIYCTANAIKSLVGQYHHPEWNFHVVKTGDPVDIGNGKKLVLWKCECCTGRTAWQPI